MKCLSESSRTLLLGIKIKEQFKASYLEKFFRRKYFVNSFNLIKEFVK